MGNTIGMIEAQLNMFDVAVIVIVLLSTVLAFFRGFVREVLSLGAWVGAAIITVYAFEPVAEVLKPHASRDMVAYLLAGVGTYLVTLLGISLFNALIIRYLKSGEEVGMLDNFLGLGFGALRGAFIISLGYLVLSLVIDEKNPPDWVENAATREFAREGALILAAVAPGYMEDISSLTNSLKDKNADEEGEADGAATAEALEEGINDAVRSTEDYLFGEPDSNAPAGREKTYSDEERTLMDNLMRSRTDDN